MLLQLCSSCRKATSLAHILDSSALSSVKTGLVMSNMGSYLWKKVLIGWFCSRKKLQLPRVISERELNSFSYLIIWGLQLLCVVFWFPFFGWFLWFHQLWPPLYPQGTHFHQQSSWTLTHWCSRAFHSTWKSSVLAFSATPAIIACSLPAINVAKFDGWGMIGWPKDDRIIVRLQTEVRVIKTLSILKSTK